MQKQPNMSAAIGLTVAALLDLAGAFFMVASSAQLAVLSGFIVCELLLIALALAQWVRYFRQYVAFEIERRLPNLQPTA